MTLNEAVHEWVNSFNAIPQRMIEKLMEYDTDDTWEEITKPTVGSRVFTDDSEGKIVGMDGDNFIVETDDDEKAWIHEYALLTEKKVIYAANVGEDDMADDGASNDYVKKVRDYAAETQAQVFTVCAQMEAEISELDDEERAMFLEDLGLKESGLDKLIKASYTLLGLISYLTAGEQESRAWTIINGTKAPQAAGKIHSDFERGFIKAEVIAYEDLIREGSMTAAKEKGLVRQEGKEYVMKDGDVVLFKFNV